MENIIFIDCIAAASEVFQKSVSDRMHPYCSELQRSAVSVSLRCITNHSKMWLKTKIIIFNDSVNWSQICSASFAWIRSSSCIQMESQLGLKVEMVACVAEDGGCWLGTSLLSYLASSSSRGG